ncbi:MAG: cation-translocating P-type ATPase [Oligoflexia bacterium]|nr:cation-translocating P-type ATPase [Oligoflexia bacterium]
MEWHQKSVEEVLREFGSSSKGLTEEAVKKMKEKFGRNQLEEKKSQTPLTIFLSQFKDFMIIVLLVAAIVSGVIGDLTDAIVIVIIVLLNAIIGFVQEYRAEKAIASLLEMSEQTAKVLRNGQHQSLSVSELVPGDVVLLEAGSLIPADLRIIESEQLKIEEATLTGESLAVEKLHPPILDEQLPLGDRKNMAYKSTLVVFGRGLGVVVAIGMNTELGKIATMLYQDKRELTPLQQRLKHLGKRLAVIVLAICLIVFILGIIRGEELSLMILTAISLAVAGIPEALPAIITIALALGAKKLATEKALIRKLPAVETLGSVTYICSDKTGTLTLNKMSISQLYFDRKMVTPKELSNNDFLVALALSNDVHPEGNSNTILGDPTEIALYNMAKERGIVKEEMEKTFHRIAEIPFDSERKCMTTFHKNSKEVSAKIISYTKGAVDVLIDRSSTLWSSSGEIPIDRDELKKINEKMAREGLRVLAIGKRTWDALPQPLSAESVERDLTLLGLMGMIDPPREEAREAVAVCKRAGIVPVMITGDHPFTAKTIASNLGILPQGDEAQKNIVLTSTEMTALSVEELEKIVLDIRVYARVAPDQKLKIIEALQKRGQFVAMTGDGVNDAPALKKADIGVAMGITGTDVSKEVAHMILLDDNFATIVKAVKEGRQIYDNIRKFVRYILTSNSGEIWTIVLAPFFGLPIPLLPIHILWINLVTDGFPCLALAAEPAEKGVMERPPRHPKESIFAHGLGWQVLWVGALMGIVSLVGQAWAIHVGNAHWQTIVFTVLCFSQMGNLLAIRSDRESFFSQGFLSNKYLTGAVLLAFALQLATIYVPFLNPIFKTAPLTLNELLFALALSSVIFFAVEIEKWIRRHHLKSSR